jgi:hypothetical protein
MKELMEQHAAIGRAKTVLVFGNGADARAVITALLAQWTSRKDIERLHFCGPVRFTAETEAHIKTVVLPAVDGVCNLLGLEPGTFDLSGVNLGAAASQDIGIDIDGFSADLPLFLAMLSARLQIPIPQDVVCTGHIASVDGDIRLVRNLPAKLEAARSDKFIERFVYPAIDADASVATLTAGEFNRVKTALATQGDSLKAIAVSGVDELLQTIFPEETIVLAALTGRYLDCQFDDETQDRQIHKAVRFLGADTQERYFCVLRSKLVAGDAAAVSGLLEKWADYWVRQKRYPQRFGNKLRQIIQSVSPSVRALKLNTLLLSVGSCIKLSQCATSADFNDVLDLYRTVARTTDIPSQVQRAQQKQPATGRKAKSSTLEIVLAEIEKEHLTSIICLPIDAARASFLLDRVTVDNSQQALDVITSFYIHLLEYTNGTAGSPGIDQAGPDAHALMDRTFARGGGAAAATAEAISGVQGGLRFVLDQMTEQFKRERQEAHVQHVIATAIDALDWDAKVGFVKEFLRRHPDVVPAELASEPPERFAKNYELIVRAYVNAMDGVKQMLRAM